MTSRRSSGSKRTESGVEPTRSQNMTVSWRRSAPSARGAAAGGGAGGWVSSAAIARSIRLRWPSTTPSFSRSASVSSGKISASIAFSRKIGSYCARSRPRSHAERSTASPGGLLFPKAQFNPIVKTPKGGTDAGHDLPQSALQHLAQNTGAVARKRRGAADHRVPEDALYGSTAEAASRTVEHAGEQAVAEKGSRGRRHRPGEAVGRSADRGDGQEPDHRRAPDRPLGGQGGARPSAGSRALGAVAAGVVAASGAGGRCGVFGGAEGAALIALGDGVGGLPGFGREHC